MSREYHYVYCEGILGVKSNISDFRWIYGSNAPNADISAYDNCIVKFIINVKPEKKLKEVNCSSRCFQSYMWCDEERRLSYRRKMPLNIEIGYDITIIGNTVCAEIGEHYYSFIKNRTMNLHGMYYLLSDIANVLLLNNGLITLYASSVYHETSKKGIVTFAAPNTGKTTTAMKLCGFPGFKFVSEDIVISDGRKLYSCPWTNSYRDSKKKNNNLTSKSGTEMCIQKELCEECELSDIVVLSLENHDVEINKDKGHIYKSVSILNGYLFNYYSSPIVKILAFFDDDFNKPWEKYAADLLVGMIENNDCYMIQSYNKDDFAICISKKILGEEI